MLLCIGSFANAIIVLNTSAQNIHRYDSSIESNNELIGKKFNNEVLDGLFTEYYIGLGEFETDGYEGHPS